MKRLLVLSILLTLGFSFTGTASADENANRPVNPGEDPNEAFRSSPFEATTSALGDCRECIAYRTGATTGKGSRRHDDTVSREIKGSSATPGGSEKAGTGRQ